MNEQSKTDNKTITSINAKFKKALSDFRLIEDNDHILIGLSGGKDSLALVELLGNRMKVFVPRFKVTAVHISVENTPYISDIEYLNSFCKSFGIDFVHRTTRFETSADSSKSFCFLCSWQRRKALFKAAEELNCNKIALGHHLDDITETLLMNLIFQGSFGSMPPVLKMDKFDMTIIRPLALISEKELKELERIRAYTKQIKNCPYEKDSSRRDAKQLMHELEKLNPDVRQSMWNAMQNIKSEYLPQNQSKSKKKSS